MEVNNVANRLDETDRTRLRFQLLDLQSKLAMLQIVASNEINCPTSAAVLLVLEKRDIQDLVDLISAEPQLAAVQSALADLTQFLQANEIAAERAQLAKQMLAVWQACRACFYEQLALPERDAQDHHHFKKAIEQVSPKNMQRQTIKTLLS